MMGSASMLLASSGILPDDCARNARSTTFYGRQHELRSRLAGNMPARASRMLALPNRAALLTRSRYWDHEFAVFLRNEVFGAAR
jgi:hypothetical protein